MSCPRSFYKQCSAWMLFVILAVPVGLIVAASVLILGMHDYPMASKAVILLGTVTCFVWWLWIMKKLQDIAAWWIELREHMNQASELLAQARQDLKEIKQNF